MHMERQMLKTYMEGIIAFVPVRIDLKTINDYSNIIQEYCCRFTKLHHAED